jgi:hypothetical protein
MLVDRDAQERLQQREALADLAFAAWRRTAPGPADWQCSGIVLSRDRPLQLHALLESYFELCRPAPRLEVLYRATAPRVQRAYDEVRREHAWRPVGFHAEADFRADLDRLLGADAAAGVFLLADDIVFTRPTDFGAFARFPLGLYVPSPRLGTHITLGYDSGRSAPPPELRDDGGQIVWSFEAGREAWATVAPLEGDVFSRAELRALLQVLPFDGPGGLEQMLCALPLWRASLGVCHRQARLLSLPLNTVQCDTPPRRHAGGDALAFLDAWEEGLRLDVQRLREATTTSTRAELAVLLVPRAGG